MLDALHHRGRFGRRAPVSTGSGPRPMHHINLRRVELAHVVAQYPPAGVVVGTGRIGDVVERSRHPLDVGPIRGVVDHHRHAGLDVPCEQFLVEHGECGEQPDRLETEAAHALHPGVAVVHEVPRKGDRIVLGEHLERVHSVGVAAEVVRQSAGRCDRVEGRVLQRVGNLAGHHVVAAPGAASPSPAAVRRPRGWLVVEAFFEVIEVTPSRKGCTTDVSPPPEPPARRPGLGDDRVKHVDDPVGGPGVGADEDREVLVARSNIHDGARLLLGTCIRGEAQNQGYRRWCRNRPATRRGSAWSSRCPQRVLKRGSVWTEPSVKWSPSTVVFQLPSSWLAHGEHRSTHDPIVGEVGQCLVSALEGIRSGVWSDPDVRCDR